MIENVIEDLKSRLSEETLNLYNLFVLFPDIYKLKTEDEINCAVTKLSEKYCKLLKTPVGVFKELLKSELNRWQTQWKSNKNSPGFDALKLLECCDRGRFPLIGNLLHVLATIPASAASAERTFSTLKRLKTWLRTTTTEDRLVGLALMNIHHDEKLNIDSIIDRYAGIRKHRHEFTI